VSRQSAGCIDRPLKTATRNRFSYRQRRCPRHSGNCQWPATCLCRPSEQMRSLGLGNEIPATAFFDGDGKLVARVLGELDKPELEHRIEWMLGKHHGKEPAPFVNGFEKKARPKSQPSIFTH
jgi:hypothetical protein